MENSHIRDEISEIKQLLLSLAQAQASAQVQVASTTTTTTNASIPGPSGLSPASKKSKSVIGAKGKQLMRKGRGKKSSTESFVILDPSPPPRRKSGIFQAALSAAGKMFSSDDEDPDYRPEVDDDDGESVHSSQMSRQTRQGEFRDDPTPTNDTETTYYIRKFQLDLNGSPVDQVKIFIKIVYLMTKIEKKNLI